MRMDFYTLPKDQGIICDECGTYIRNIYSITLNDGYNFKVGSECFKKLEKRTNLSEYGTKALNKLLKLLNDYDKSIKDWEKWNTPEEAEIDKCFQRIEDKNCWRIRTQKEFEKEKDLMLTFYILARIEQTQKQIEEKFKNIKLNIEG